MKFLSAVYMYNISEKQALLVQSLLLSVATLACAAGAIYI